MGLTGLKSCHFFPEAPGGTASLPFPASGNCLHSVPVGACGPSFHLQGQQYSISIPLSDSDPLLPLLKTYVMTLGHQDNLPSQGQLISKLNYIRTLHFLLPCETTYSQAQD